MVRRKLNENDLSTTANPSDPIGASVVATPPSQAATYLDLMHLPSQALAWLFTRPLAQTNTAGMIGRTLTDTNPVVDATLLRHDQNVLVLTLQSGQKLYVYPDGGIGHNSKPIQADPAALMQAVGMDPMGMNPMGVSAMGMAPMSAPVPVTEPGVDLAAFDNIANGGDPLTVIEPTEALGDVTGTQPSEATHLIQDNGAYGPEEEGRSEIDRWLDSLEIKVPDGVTTDAQNNWV